MIKKTLVDNISVCLEMKEMFAIGRSLDRSFLLSEGFFNNGLIIDDLKGGRQGTGGYGNNYY